MRKYFCVSVFLSVPLGLNIFFQEILDNVIYSNKESD